MKRLVIVSMIAGGWFVMTANPSLAASPSSTRDVVGTDSGLYISCPSFDVGFSATYNETLTDFRDANGDVVRSTLHLRFTGSLYNESDPSRSLPYQGTAYVASTAGGQIATGSYIAWIDGHAMQLETGLFRVDFSTGDVTLHGLWQDQVLCGPLS